MMHEEGWTDTFAKASIWGGTDRQHTCHASSKAKHTRRDYIFVNRYLLPAIGGVRVQYCDDYPTHQPVQIENVTATIEIACRKLKKIDSVAKVDAKKIEEATDALEVAQAAQSKAELKGTSAWINSSQEGNKDWKNHRRPRTPHRRGDSSPQVWGQHPLTS